MIPDDDDVITDDGDDVINEDEDTPVGSGSSCACGEAMVEVGADATTIREEEDSIACFRSSRLLSLPSSSSPSSR